MKSREQLQRENEMIQNMLKSVGVSSRVQAAVDAVEHGVAQRGE